MKAKLILENQSADTRFNVILVNGKRQEIGQIYLDYPIQNMHPVQFQSYADTTGKSNETIGRVSSVKDTIKTTRHIAQHFAKIYAERQGYEFIDNSKATLAGVLE